MALVAHQLLFAGVIVVMLAASWRFAGALGARGLERAVAAAPIAATAAGLEALLLGLIGAGGDSLALAGAALVTWGTAQLVPLPAEVGGSAAAWWRARTNRELIALAAAVGAAVAWEVWILRRPAIGLDGNVYHLPEAVGWVQGGHPGTVQTLFHAIPYGNFPRAHEVVLSWLMALSHSLLPTTLLDDALWLLLVFAGAVGLRRLKVRGPALGLAVAAVAGLPIVLGQLPSPDTDLPALAWLCASAALCAAAPAVPGLLAPALLAAGLAVSTKTTTLPLAAFVLVLAAWSVRAQLRARAWVLTLALLAALGISAPWYIGDWVEHGWPLWPFSSGPTGEAVPDAYRILQHSFLSNPSVVNGRLGDYGKALGGGVVLLVGAVLMPLVCVAGARRRVLIGTGATLVAALLWAASPWSGSGPTTELAVSTVRYALPVVAAAAVTVALAARGATGLRRTIVLAVLGLAVAVEVWRWLAVGPPAQAPAWVPVAGAAVLAALSALALRWRGRQPLPPMPRGWARTGVALAAVIVVGLAATLLARHYAIRHARAGLYDAGLVSWFAAQPSWRDGSAPIAMWPGLVGVLTGDSLQHRLGVIADRTACSEVRASAARGWVVLQLLPSGGYGPFARCLRGLSLTYSDALYHVFTASPTQR